MPSRIELQRLLEGILGSRNVYFQPPTNIKMKYPAIVYQRDTIEAMFADNLPYKLDERYSIMVIDPDPDSKIPGKIAHLPSCYHTRRFTADNLNHDVFTIHY